MVKQSALQAQNSDDPLSLLGLHSLQVDLLISSQSPRSATRQGNKLLFGTLFAHVLHNHRPACFGPAGEIFGTTSAADVTASLHVHHLGQTSWMILANYANHPPPR